MTAGRSNLTTVRAALRPEGFLDMGSRIRIRGIDDAAVDHIEQYWLGGKTIPENARLAHRYCNMARPRHDTA